jgi:uracil-DNA glycosylase
MNPIPNQLTESIDHQIAALTTDWRSLVQAWRQTAEAQQLCKFIQARQEAGTVIFPQNIFRALQATPLSETRVVILGQDPYHGPGQADGLAFSVPKGQPIPPSLRNIFAQRSTDLGLPRPATGDLQNWAQKGVLLLNTTLTVEQSLPASHAGKGWQTLTDRIIETAAQHALPKVFMLWGSHAQAKQTLIQPFASRHLVLTSNHPSPLSAQRPPVPFIGNQHFKLCVEFLRAHTPAKQTPSTAANMSTL